MIGTNIISTGLFLVSFVIMLAGMISIIIPFLPSVLLIWIGILVYGIGTDFAVIDANFLLIASLIAFGTILLDYINNAFGRRRYYGSLWGILGAVAGGFIGSMFGMFGGLVVGPILGAIVSEMIRGRDNIFGIETDRFTVIGYVGGTIVKFASGVAMIGLFLWKITRPA